MCFVLKSSPRLKYKLSKVNYSPTPWGLVSHRSTCKSPHMPHVSPGWVGVGVSSDRCIRNDNFTLVAAVFDPNHTKNSFKQDLDDVSQFFVRSEVKPNPLCSDSGFAEPRTPIATSASQPTVTLQSSNPFRRDETVSNDEKSSELSADRRIRKPVKVLEDFDGKQPLKEYLLHFERCSLINGCTEEEKAMFSAASLCGESRKLLSGLTESEG